MVVHLIQAFVVLMFALAPADCTSSGNINLISFSTASCDSKTPETSKMIAGPFMIGYTFISYEDCWLFWISIVSFVPTATRTG